VYFAHNDMMGQKDKTRLQLTIDNADFLLQLPTLVFG